MCRMAQRFCISRRADSRGYANCAKRESSSAFGVGLRLFPRALHHAFGGRIVGFGFLLRRRNKRRRPPLSSHLTRGNARGHIRRMALPAAVGLFCNTLFNITDTFYAGWIATEAQAALAFAFPLYFLQLSLCIGLLQATTTKVAAATGAKDMHSARRLTGQGVFLGFLVVVFVWIALLPFSGAMLGALGAAGAVREFALDYVVVIFAGAPAFVGAFALNGALHAVGNTRAFRNSIATATAVNVVLDPALMFGWFGLPALGMAGIGLATVIAQGGCALYLLFVLSRSPLASGFRRAYLLPDAKLLRELAVRASSPTGRMLCINVGFFIIAGFLGHFGAAAVAGYGIALRMEQLFLLPTIGMESAMLAYSGQNFGARRPARVAAAYMLCLRRGFVVVGCGALVMIFGGDFLVGLFNDDPEVRREGARYLILAAASGPLYVVLNVACAVFLAAGRHAVILVVNGLRLAAAPAVLAYMLVFVFGAGVAGIWYALFVCNTAAAVYAHFRCLREIRAQKLRRADLDSSAF